VFVKICGITNEEDALLAVALGADCIGFNFVAGSPRQISPNEAEEIRRRLPNGTVTVGVFKNESPEKIVSIVTQTGLSGAQLHGREPLSEVRWIRKRLPFVIQAFSADDSHLDNAGTSPADIILIDAATPGSGRVFDWRLASNAPSGVRLMVAGGLNPDNVVEAIQQIKPYGVDVATGVESSPGRKDAKKMQKFIDLAKGLSDIEKEHATVSSEQSPSMHEAKGAIYDWMDDGQ
jgi:phosphoribosylanthranilate isomerase